MHRKNETEINCNNPNTADTYSYKLNVGPEGRYYIDHLVLPSKGIEVSKKCRDLSLHFTERSCIVEISTQGNYADIFRKIFGPKGNRLKIETQSFDMKIFADGDNQNA